MGKLIVLEGTDGSGKTTQLGLLCDRLTQTGIAYRKLEYPCYGTKGASLVEYYLNGGLGSDPNAVNAYASSSFFAADRYVDFHNNWKADYEAGGLFVAGRYTTSNAVHQAAKLDGQARTDYLNWLFHYEYDLMGLPKPDLVLFLDLPSDMTFTNLYTRQQDKGDIHELDHDYLEKCRESALELCGRYGWHRVQCAPDNKLRTVQEINDELLHGVLEALKN